ncbi:MAG: ferredoxin reductase [Lacisediminihabitans sp.]
MSFAPATITAVRQETPGARTLTLDAENWPGHKAGQHVDVRLTAENGYTAVRSYSIASSAASGVLKITVDRLVDGEVSPYLVDVAEIGDRVEVRGPAGGWFVWRGTSDEPVQLIGGGSGVVPLMSMIRSHGDAASTAPFRLLYSVRSPTSALFYDELAQRTTSDRSLTIDFAFSRATPQGWPSTPARLDRAAVEASVLTPDTGATIFVCGSTPFVEAIANWLVEAGHPPDKIRTERFGGIGVSP